MAPNDNQKGSGRVSYDEAADELLNASKRLWRPEDRHGLESAPNVPPPSVPASAQSRRPRKKPKEEGTHGPAPKSAKSKQPVPGSKQNTASVGSPAISTLTRNRPSPSFRHIVRDVTLLAGESKEDYQNVAGVIEADLNPETPTEFIFVSRFTYIQWDIRRVHIWRDQLRRRCAKEAFVALLKPHLKVSDDHAVAALWRDGNPAKKTRTVLEEADLTETAIVAYGLAQNLSLFEALDLMEARLEMRGHTILHELERHREAQGRYYRRLLEGTSVTPQGREP